MPTLKLQCPGIEIRIRPSPSFECTEIGILQDGAIVEVKEETIDGFYELSDGKGFVIMGDGEEIFYHPIIASVTFNSAPSLESHGPAVVGNVDIPPPEKPELVPGATVNSAPSLDSQAPTVVGNGDIPPTPAPEKPELVPAASVNSAPSFDSQAPTVVGNGDIPPTAAPEKPELVPAATVNSAPSLESQAPAVEENGGTLAVSEELINSSQPQVHQDFEHKSNSISDPNASVVAASSIQNDDITSVPTEHESVRNDEAHSAAVVEVDSGANTMVAQSFANSEGTSSAANDEPHTDASDHSPSGSQKVSSPTSEFRNGHDDDALHQFMNFELSDMDYNDRTKRPNGWAEVLHCRIEKLKSQKRIEGMSEEEITACHEQFEADVDKEMLHGVRVLIRNAKWGHGKSKPEPKTFHAELAKVKSSRQKG